MLFLKENGSMATVELIYDHDCPNITQARENLLRAFDQVHLTPQWREWNRSDPAAPPYVRTFGSPTVLVNGKDVAGPGLADAACCRIYATGGGSHQRAPPVALIAAELAKAEESAP
jgi:mercuric ion transport protein